MMPSEITGMFFYSPGLLLSGYTRSFFVVGIWWTVLVIYVDTVWLHTDLVYYKIGSILKGKHFLIQSPHLVHGYLISICLAAFRVCNHSAVYNIQHRSSTLITVICTAKMNSADMTGFQFGQNTLPWCIELFCQSPISCHHQWTT